MAKFVQWLRLHLAAALTATGLLSGASGFILNDFASWRSANRDFLKTQAEASQKADQELIDILRKFSNKALGKAPTTDDDLRTLHSSVTRSYKAASSLAERMPALKPEFEQYADALISLQKSAEKLSGPLDGKTFVEAVSAYADRRKKFEAGVAKMQSSWL